MEGEVRWERYGCKYPFGTGDSRFKVSLIEVAAAEASPYASRLAGRFR